MSNYEAKLLGWMKENKIEDSSLKSYFQSAADDASKEAMANMYRTFLVNKREKVEHQNHADEEHMILEPYRHADGSFGYIDRKQGRVIVSVIRHANGLFSYSGPRKYLEILGGRGSMSGIVDRMADGDYFNKG